MNYDRRSPWLLALSLTAALACGTEGDDTLGGSTGLTSTTATTGSTDSTTGATDPATTDTPTSDPSTSGATDSASSDPGTTDTSATTDPVTTTDTSTGDPGTTTIDDSTTGVDVAEFDRFQLSRAAGPCPPDADCDGFIELLAEGTLRFEKFGELGNPVQEAQVSDEDLAAAAAVFADPALIALLDGPDPACDPPTDIFESMVSEIEGAEHEAATTFCAQPPIAAAREMADMLQTKYLP
jgi:hypothetical protein